MTKRAGIGLAVLALVAVAGVLTYILWPGGGSPAEVLAPTPSPSPGSDLILDVAPCSGGEVGVGIKVTNSAGVSSVVAGDHVDVVAKVAAQTETVLRDVRVVALAHGSLEPAPRVVSLCLAPEDARRLALADKGPGTEFVLVPRPSAQ